MPPNKAYNLSALRRHYTNPHGLYDELRISDSIYFDALNQCWLVTGHAPVMAILHDSRFSSQLELASPTPMGTPSPFHRLVSKQYVFMDGDAHRRAQQVTLKLLAHMVKSMPEQIRLFTRMALEGVQEKEEIDLVRDFASPVSSMVISHLLGIPFHEYDQLLHLEQWSDTFGDITSGYFRGSIEDIGHLEEYFRQLIATKKRSPSNDLLSAFIEARDVFPDDDDLIANCMMVFSAGRVTTKKLLGNGIPVLLGKWEQLQAELRQNSALPKLLGEELLRFITPTRSLIRRASEDIDLSQQFPGNHRISKGEKVFLFLEAANYDPACFVQPKQYHPHRRPNKHIAFGHGAHQCPGATLARVEVKIALETLLTLFTLSPKPNVRPVWNPNPNLGGFTSYSALLAKKHDDRAFL